MTVAPSSTLQQKVPLVDLAAQYREIGDDVDAAIRRVLETTKFILGSEVEGFERAFSEQVGGAETVGVASGTAGLHLALIACGVGPGDEVITTAHTFIATAEAISHAGATPVFVDIDPVTYNLDPQRVEDAITPGTRAVMPVHLYGHPADLDPLLDICRRHNLRLIEDAAQAHAAEYRGRRCGSIGDLAAFSFYPGKNLGAYGDAGAVTGTDPDLVRRVRKLRDHGRTSKYEHDEIGFGERIDALQAAILAVKVRHLERWTEARRAAAARYRELLADVSVEPPVEADWARHVYHLFVVRVADRDRVLRELGAAGVGAGVHYPLPLHRQPAYAHLEARDLPETDRAAREVLSLPLYPEITAEQQRHVVDTLAGLVR